MLWWPADLDRGLLDECMRALLGRHDFTAFTPTETDHVRFERDCAEGGVARASGDMLELWIEADTFMRHMVRTIVGTMLEVASGSVRSRTSSVSWRAGPVRRRGRRRPRTGSRWHRSRSIRRMAGMSGDNRG